jgi:23S rRNA (cytidine1920-2'-O)/16S rRNA (cytidine1409-2'-O)-methyltransferase
MGYAVCHFHLLLKRKRHVPRNASRDKPLQSPQATRPRRWRTEPTGDNAMSMNAFHARVKRPVAARFVRPKPSSSGMLRADALLVAQGLARSRAEARGFIKAGHARWTGGAITKSSLELPANTELTVAAEARSAFVSRGCLKLAGALEQSGLAIGGWTCLDIDQSTGGFSDCLLAAGAARVVGVDVVASHAGKKGLNGQVFSEKSRQRLCQIQGDWLVGHDQLHPRLCSDPRILCLEGVNCRTLAAADLGDALPPDGFDLIVADVSFISLTLLLPHLPPLLTSAGHMLLLVKPQFEVGQEGVGKGGIVRDAALYAEVARKLRRACAELGLAVRDWFASPITGGDGNREFFIWTTHTTLQGHETQTVD